MMFYIVHTNIPDPLDDCIQLVFEMGKKCNRVDYNNEKFCRFINDNGKDETTLMLIPYKNILLIERIEENNKNE